MLRARESWHQDGLFEALMGQTTEDLGAEEEESLLAKCD